MVNLSASPISTAAEAFAAVALAAVACDGELTSLEARSLRQQLEFREPYCHLSDQAMGALLDRLLRLLREQGWQALVNQAAPLLPPQATETALAVAAALTQADSVLIAPLYAAGEAPIPGVTSAAMAQAVRELAPGLPVLVADSLEELASQVALASREGDLVLAMGAGDVNGLWDRLGQWQQAPDQGKSARARPLAA